MKNTKGITLIALVVTIIVLLILAGVSIAMLTGDNGIIGNSKKTSTQNAYYQAEEQFKLAYMAVRTEIMSQTVSRGTYAPVADLAHLSSVVKADLNSDKWTVKYQTVADANAAKASDATGVIYVMYQDDKIDKGVIDGTLPKDEGRVTFTITVKNQGSTNGKQSCDPAYDTQHAGTTDTINFNVTNTTAQTSASVASYAD